MTTNDSPVPYSVRLPKKMRDILKKVAKNNGRSLHAEILLRLEQSLKKTPESELMANIDLKEPDNYEILLNAIRQIAKEDQKS